MMAMSPRASTLGELISSGWRDRSVKDELRENFVERTRRGDDLFPGIVGYEDTVLPALERALLAGHDIILLGERGQAKTRLIRSLVSLLDDEIPVIAGCEINDSPARPVCASCRALLADRGNDTPIVWLARDRRYAEKLATPDTSVADLIGDIDPIRVAEGRYLSDELTIHYGLVPRTHRGIFSVNELPDLPERIQVALLNILEERDVQIRGYNVRLQLDLLLVASANPEDYTNRGRIISPLKDRFGSEVRTHYPEDPEHEIAIMHQEAKPSVAGVPVVVPPFVAEVIAEFTQQLRRSAHINQRSGVSVRFSIGGLETVTASAVRRAIRTGEREAVPRISDLPGAVRSSMGRVEFESFEEGREAEILEQLARKAILDVFRRRLSGFDFSALLARFDEGLSIDTGDLVLASDLLKQAGDVKSMPGLLKRLGVVQESPALAASALEFALEGLHLSRRLNKHATASGARYGS
jgi:magnesium chelatase subunit I